MDEYGYTDLMIAIVMRNFELAERLSNDPSTDINRAADDGNTALHFASIDGQTRLCRIILSRKDVRVNTQDKLL